MRRRSPGVDAEVSLAWLLEPLSVQTFLDEVWGKVTLQFASARPLDALLPGLRPEQQTDLARTLIVSGFLVRLPNGGADREHD